MADKDYNYIYFEVFDYNGVMNMPEGQSYVVHHCDAIVFYFDPDPDNRAIGVPYQDAADPYDGMLSFTVLGDGSIPDIGPKTEFLSDPANFQFFKSEDGLTYGFEMRVPRVEEEESFAMNAVIMDMDKDANGAIDGNITPASNVKPTRK